MKPCEVCGEHEVTTRIVVENDSGTDTAIIGYTCDSRLCKSQLLDKGQRWGFDLAKRLNNVLAGIR